ncbi:MAG: hypothetical protein WKF73_18130 [Nocardioidaceae bacterium]
MSALLVTFDQRGSAEEAVAAARADLRCALDDIVVHARGHELLRVVQSVPHRDGDGQGGARGGAQPAAAVLELIALALACRDAAGNFAPGPESDPEYFPPNVQAAAQAALDAGAMIRVHSRGRLSWAVEPGLISGDRVGVSA